MKEKCTAVVLAAGHGSRMGTKIPKQFIKIHGIPLIVYSLRAFQRAPEIDEIVLVTTAKSLIYCRTEIAEAYHLDKVRNIVVGGTQRYHSVYNGLLACADTRYVFIHDGARAMVDEAIIRRGYADVQAYGASVAAVPAKDTIKIADKDAFVCDTPKRSQTWVIQTPQVFDYACIRAAYEEVLESGADDITDDAMILERTRKHRVHLYMGSYTNIKVTTPEDIGFAEQLLNPGEI